MDCKVIHIVWLLLCVLLVPAQARGARSCDYNDILLTITEAADETAAEQEYIVTTNPEAEAETTPSADALTTPEAINGAMPDDVPAQTPEAKANHIQALALPVADVEALLSAEPVNISRPSLTLRQIISVIQKQTSYKVAINWSGVSPDTAVAVNPGVMSVLELLEQSLKNTELEYYLVDRYLLITRVPKKAHNSETDSADVVAVDLSETLAEMHSPLEELVEPDADTAKLVIVTFDMGQSRINRRDSNNAKALEGLDSLLSDSARITKLDYINITAQPAPDEQALFSESAARRRAQSLKSYITYNYPAVEDEKIHISMGEEDWQGLERIIRLDPGMPYQDDVLTLLNNPISNEQKKARLRTMSGGVVQRYMSTNILPNLRSGAAYTVHFNTKEPEPVIDYVAAGDEHLLKEPVDVKEIAKPVVKPSDGKLESSMLDFNPLVQSVGHHIYIAIRSNILYDAILIPNIGVELACVDKMSFLLEATGSWNASYYEGRYFYLARNITGELRWWFRQPSSVPLRGHYLGFYVMGSGYKVQHNNNSYVHNKSFGMGFSYGYSFALAKRLNLDLGVSVGFHDGNFASYKYDSARGRYSISNSDNSYWFGPTKAQISLVWLIGRNYNDDK